MTQLSRHVTSESQQASTDIARQRPRSQDLRECPGGLAPPEFQLKKSIPRHVEALGEEQVMFVPSVDMSDSPTISEDLDGLSQPRDAEFFRFATVRAGKDRQTTGRVQNTNQPTPMSHGYDSLGCSVGYNQLARSPHRPFPGSSLVPQPSSASSCRAELAVATFAVSPERPGPRCVGPDQVRWTPLSRPQAGEADPG